jgi:hypothetical protein
MRRQNSLDNLGGLGRELKFVRSRMVIISFHDSAFYTSFSQFVCDRDQIEHRNSLHDFVCYTWMKARQLTAAGVPKKYLNK